MSKTPTELLDPEIVERRTAIAKMRSLELGVEKDYLALQEKKKNICRIDAALGAFDAFLVDFVEMLTSLPDYVQSIIPECRPDQYATLQSFIDGQLQRLSQKRLYLTIESTSEEQAAATEAKVESQKKATKMKKGKK